MPSVRYILQGWNFSGCMAGGWRAEAERKQKGRWTIEYSMDDGRDAVMDDGRWQVAKAERGLYSLLTANTPTL
jgi:hypothetical protein